MRRTASFRVLPLLLLVCLITCHGWSLNTSDNSRRIQAATTTSLTSRRQWIQAATQSAAGMLGLSILAMPLPLMAVEAAVRNTITLTITQEERLGLELEDTTVGTKGREVVAIRRVVKATPLNSNLRPGMILRDFDSAAIVQARILNGPYPFELVFENLAAGGDAIADDGKPLVTAQDALELAKQQSQQQPRTKGDIPQSVLNNGEYKITRVQDVPTSACTIQTRRGDVLEIHYEAHLNAPDGVVYDSSSSRGTGQPYQMVLGSGDMLSGVDQGLYDMCVGEERVLQIPPILAYGSRGNKLYHIPPDTVLYWNVELISINGIQKGDTRTRDEVEGRVPYY